MATVVGVPREIKDGEMRVSMQPDGVAELEHHGHEVVVEEGAGVVLLMPASKRTRLNLELAPASVHPSLSNLADDHP